MGVLGVSADDWVSRLVPLPPGEGSEGALTSPFVILRREATGGPSGAGAKRRRGFNERRA